MTPFWRKDELRMKALLAEQERQLAILRAGMKDKVEQYDAWIAILTTEKRALNDDLLAAVRANEQLRGKVKQLELEAAKASTRIEGLEREAEAMKASRGSFVLPPGVRSEDVDWARMGMEPPEN